MPASDADISADALRTARREAGYTQAEAAERIGVHAMTLSTWERGVAAPRPSLVPKIASVYGISVNGLLTENARGTLRAARLAKGLTVHEVGDLVGLAGSSYHYLETNGVNPATFNQDTLRTLAASLDLDLETATRLITK